MYNSNWKKYFYKFHDFSMFVKLNKSKESSARIIPISFNLSIFISKPILDIQILQRFQKKTR